MLTINYLFFLFLIYMSGFINDNVTVGMLRDAMRAKAIPEGSHLKPPVSMLGFGLPGGQPPGGLLGGGGGTYGGTGMEGGSTRSRDRDVLRRGFGRFKPRESLEKHRHSVVRVDEGILNMVDTGGAGTALQLLSGLAASIGDYYKIIDQSEITKIIGGLTVAGWAGRGRALSNIYKNNKNCIILMAQGAGPMGRAYALYIFDQKFIDSGGSGGFIVGLAPVPAAALPDLVLNQANLNTFFALGSWIAFGTCVICFFTAPTQFVNMAVEKTLEDRKNPRIITPFRQAYNAGDVAGTVDQRTLEPASNQVNGIAPVNSLRKYERSRGAASGGKSLFTGNPRYVYDSSDYIRYRKLVSKNKNYNDLSFGGDESNASQVSIMRNF